MPFLSPRALASAWPSVIPMSSTVWCASISRSPLACTVRSRPPWRASWSSMWSRNGMPEASLASPVPSRSTATKTWVSLVSRWTSALRMVGGEGRGKRLDQFRVLVGGADREPQAVGEQGMRAVKVADQYTTRLQGAERARRVGHAHEHEVGGGAETARAGQRVERPLEPRALRDDGARLLVEHLAPLEQQLSRGGAQRIHVVGRAQFLDLVHPGGRAGGDPDAQPRQAQLGDRAHDHEVRVPAGLVHQRSPARERVIRFVD